VPSLAYDLEFDVRHVLRTDYVIAEQSDSGLAHPRIAAATAALESPLLAAPGLLCP
jgi:hypothetical protein